MKSAMTYCKVAAAVSALFALSSVAAGAEPAGGGHIDVQGGYDSMAIPDLTGIAPGSTTGSSRALFGIGAGYDVPVGGPITVGIDSDLDFSGSSRCTGGAVQPGDQLCNRLRHDFDVGARLGVQAGPALLYGKIAYDVSAVRSSFTDPNGNVTTVSENAHGSRFGAGVQYGLGGHVYVKTEYRYTPSHGGVGNQNQVLGGVGIHFF